MADEMGFEPTYIAMFEHTFQKKDKTWCSDRAKAVKDKYEELWLARTIDVDGGDGGDGAVGSEPSVDSMAIWMEASREANKGKIYGMGPLSRVDTPMAGATSSSNSPASRRRFEEQVNRGMSQLQELLVQKDMEIKELRAHNSMEMRAIKDDYESQLSQRDVEMREMKERYQALEAQNAFIFQHLNLNRNQVPLQVPPVHPPAIQSSDGHNNDEWHDDDEHTH